MIFVTLGCAGSIVLVGIFLLFAAAQDEDLGSYTLGVAILLFGALGVCGLNDATKDESNYIQAEPLAYNQTQTVFTTDKGTRIVDGIYPDGKYMLDIDGDTVLVVWQVVEGEEVGLG